MYSRTPVLNFTVVFVISLSIAAFGLFIRQRVQSFKSRALCAVSRFLLEGPDKRQVHNYRTVRLRSVWSVIDPVQMQQYTAASYIMHYYCVGFRQVEVFTEQALHLRAIRIHIQLRRFLETLSTIQQGRYPAVAVHTHTSPQHSKL